MWFGAPCSGEIWVGEEERSVSRRGSWGSGRNGNGKERVLPGVLELPEK